MASDLSEIIGILFLSVFLVSLFADMFFSATWNKTYFTTGLTIFVKRIPVRYSHRNIPFRHSNTDFPHPSDFEKEFHSDLISSLTFMEIDMSVYGFREKFFQLKLIGYSSIMRGLIMFDTSNNQVVVKGFINWSILVFSLVWLSVPISFLVQTWSGDSMLFSPLFPLGAIAFFILVTGICYMIQYYRFLKVASFAAQAWLKNT